MHRSVSLLLNIAHAIDHLFLLIFATAVAAIAKDFGLARWEDLMPFGTGAFLLFGLGSLPAGKLGDQWGRRQMMLVFFFGMGLSALLVAATRGPWQLAAALTLMGAFSSIYHPVGIPMLVQHATKPGAAIGINGLAGNLGIAAAAIVTGVLVEHAGWRAAFALPGLACLGFGLLFWWRAPRESESPAQRTRKASVQLAPLEFARVLAVMTVASASGGLVFNLTTNGNGQMLGERLAALADDPSTLGLLLGAVYAVASLAQVIVGRLIDRFPLKPMWLAIVLAQAPMLALGGLCAGLVGLAGLARRDDLHLRCHPVHRCHDRSLRRRQHAQPRRRHAPGDLAGDQLGGGVGAGARREGGRLRNLVCRDGRRGPVQCGGAAVAAARAIANADRAGRAAARWRGDERLIEGRRWPCGSRPRATSRSLPRRGARRRPGTPSRASPAMRCAASSPITCGRPIRLTIADPTTARPVSLYDGAGGVIWALQYLHRRRRELPHARRVLAHHVRGP